MLIQFHFKRYWPICVKFVSLSPSNQMHLQPSNVLLDSDCFVKLCDFGLARSLTGRSRSRGPNSGVPYKSTVPALTEYVATRWYRAPEILLACHDYTKGVDIWSLGCILGEMLVGSPLFPGTSTLDQIERIMAGLPKPSKEGLFRMRNAVRFQSFTSRDFFKC